MRIVQFIQKKQRRGAETFASQLSQHLKNAGHEVLMICLEDGNDILPFDGTIQVLHANLQKRFWDLRTWKKLANLIKDFKADIIQANAADTLKYAVFSKIIFGWKSKIVFRNANKMGDFIRSRTQRFVNQFFLNKVDFVASVSEACKSDIIQTFSIPAHKVSTLPIGVEELQIEPYADLAFLGISKTQKVFLSVASFVPEKNHEGLIRIFKKIHDASPHTTLLLIGEGKLIPTIESLVRTLGLQDAVVFAGVRSDVLNIMPACTALLMPSLIEGLPAVILEAFYSKLPVVAYNVGGISEVVNHKNGWLIEKNHQNEFVQAVKEIIAIKNTPEVKQKILHAHSYVHEYHLNTQIANRFITTYNSISE